MAKAKKKSSKNEKKKTRRTRSPHPGVVILRREVGGKLFWRARWTDPDTGREAYLTLGERLNITNPEQRKEWAVKKSEQIRQRKADIAAGIPLVAEETIEAAVKAYTAMKKRECRESTLDQIKRDAARFEKWAGRQGIQYTKDLNRARLALFRDHVSAMKKTKANAGVKRGVRKTTKKPLSPQSKNDILRRVATMLRDWRRRDLLPGLDSDAIRDSLRPVKTPRPVPDYLTAEQIRDLLIAAIYHDVETYRMTRAEHDGLRLPGTTRRHVPAAPFILTLLLTGARRSEIEGLLWTEVEGDEQGIVLDPVRVKTAAGRRIDLAVSPSLVDLLRVLRKGRGRGKNVFRGKDEPWSAGLSLSVRRRLARDHHAPEFTWQMLRRTCSTFVTCARLLGPWVSAARSGHSVAVAQRHYAGLLTGESAVDPDAKTIEQAMGIEDLAGEIIRQAMKRAAEEAGTRRSAAPN